MLLFWWVLARPAAGAVASIARVALLAVVSIAVLIYLGFDPIGEMRSLLWEWLIGDVIP